jgi:hypothetical protein
MSGVAHSSYSRRGIFCNGLFADALDRLHGEALSRQIAGGPEALAPCLDDLLSAGGLGLERGHGSLDVLGPDAPRREVVPDQQVAGPAPCEQLGAPSGHPLVVDRAGTNQALDRFLPRLRSDVRPGEPIRELPLGEVPVRKRPRGPVHRLVPSQLPPQPTRPCPVELDSHVEARREHDLGRQSPPRLALERNLDP